MFTRNLLAHTWFLALAAAAAAAVAADEAPRHAGSADDAIAGATIHVALGGDDTNPGSADKPLATLAGAQQAVRQLDADAAVTVVLHGGRYELSEPLTFTAADSGKLGAPVVWRAAEGEKVVLSGGRILTGWKSSGNHRWAATLPKVKSGAWFFRALWADGQRMTRARWPDHSMPDQGMPDQGMIVIKTTNPLHTEFTFSPNAVETDVAGAKTEMVCRLMWSIDRGFVTTMTGQEVTTETSMGWLGHGLRARPGFPCYFENHPDFITQPNEWALDPRSGQLLAMGDAPTQRTFIAPVLEKLLIIEGTADKPVSYLQFRNITFAHTLWPMPRIGYRGIQAGYYGTSEKPPEPVFCQPAAIEMRWAEQCRFERCTVAHTQAHGIGIGEGCQANTVVGCIIEDIGGTGVHVGLRKGPLLSPINVLDADWDKPLQVPVGNRIANNRIRRCGQFSSGCVGIFAAFVKDTVIAHNDLSDLPYTGISIGFRWSPIPSSMAGAIIEYNHIHNVTNDVVDGGGIYTLGVQPGTILRGNYIHDVHRSAHGHGAPNNGFFLDESSKGYTIEKNIVHTTSGKPVRHNRNDPAGHTWKDNYFGVMPDSPKFPKAIAVHAGLESGFRDLLEQE